MRENNAFSGNPTPSQIAETLDLYFQCCSVTINTSIGSVIAATLANSGTNPITKVPIIEKNVIRDCLSLMFACGMYDFSGQFAFKIGLPAKSGVSGCLLLVIPNCCGICIWSPRLDKMGNSVRGVEFCKKFVEATNYKYHIFNNFITRDDHIQEDNALLIQRLISASAGGDILTVKKLDKLVDYSEGDYDGRTALHLSSSEGHPDIVEFLVKKGIEINPKDRWGNTPHHEASKGLRDTNITLEKRNKYQRICKILTEEINAPSS
jgi:glutaminase